MYISEKQGCGSYFNNQWYYSYKGKKICSHFNGMTLRAFRCGTFKCIRMYCSIEYDSSMV